MFKGKWI